MDNVNHTPAPWHICGITGHGLKLIRDENGYCIAQAVKPAMQSAQYINADANARLIAAAPELLAALLAVLETHSATGGSANAAAKLANAAIAKAMGQ